MMQLKIQTARAVSPVESEGVEERAEHVCQDLRKDKNCVSFSRTFTSNVVRRSPQRAGWAEGGIRKLTEETTTNVPYKVLNQILSHVSVDLLIGKFD